MKKMALPVGLTVVICALAVVTVRQQKEITRLREVAAKPPVVAKAQPSQPVAKAPEPPPEVSPTPPIEPAQEPASPVAPKPKTPNMFSKFGEMAKDPAFKDMMRSQQKMALDMMYGSLFKSLNLSTEEISAFKDLIVDRQMAMMDGGMAMMNGELSPTDRAQRAKDMQGIKASYDKKIEEFLGPDDYAVFKDYEETLGERTQVNMFKQSLAGDDALTDEQETDLIAAMTEARKSLPNADLLSKSNRDPTKFTKDGIAEMEKVLDELQGRYLQNAGAILSATQLEHFKKSLEQMHAMQAMGLKMAAQMFDEQQAPPVAP